MHRFQTLRSVVIGRRVMSGEASTDSIVDGGKTGKRCRVEEETDRRTRALLAMSRYCQDQWVRKMIMLHMRRGERTTLALLSGDAGCGKSFALSMLERKLKSLGVSVVVSAMTNKAASALTDSGSLDKVYTFHKMMGFKKELLDNKLSLEDFTKQYYKVHWSSIAQFTTLHQSFLSADHSKLTGKHACEKPRPESCAVCSKTFAELRESENPTDLAPMKDAPPFLGVNVLIVDEYGLLNVDLFEKMLCCLTLFYGPGKGPLIIFSGSVSQLQPVDTALRIWETERFERLLSSSTPLFVNRRQFRDPGYAEALSYLQFNTVTKESRRIFRSQVSVCERDVMNPSYAPEKLRIFHRDDQQTAYTAAYLKRVNDHTRVGEKFLRVQRTHVSRGGPGAWYEVLRQAAQSLPKLFTVPKYRRGIRAAERDYLNGEKLWIGCRVRMVWHMDTNGIRVVNRKKMTPSLLTYEKETRAARDSEGVVQMINFKPETQANEFIVKGEQSGTLYKVNPSSWNYDNWKVTTHPLACLLAMNTYDCQGCTVRGHVLYHPPRCFSMSPIKPSVYVALTRVVSREHLQMTNCNFAERIGTVDFYDNRLVTYRKRVEMNYTS